MSKQKAIEWKSGTGEAEVEGEARIDVECLEPFMVAGDMAAPGQRVSNVPAHMAKDLEVRGKCKALTNDR